MVTRLINEMIEEQLLDRDGQFYVVRNSVHKNAANAATNGHTTDFTDAEKKRQKFPSNLERLWQLGSA